MHEYSIVSALLAQVDGELRKHAEPRVLGVRIRVGELAGVDSELLGTAWTLFREGTACAGAELEVVPEPATWRCPKCDGAIAPGERLRCTRCSVPARLSEGDALVLERIEMEVGDV